MEENKPQDGIAILYQPHSGIFVITLTEIIQAVVTFKGISSEEFKERVSEFIDLSVEDFMHYANENSIPFQYTCGFLIMGIDCVEVIKS